EAEDQAHGGRLARAVGAEEAGHPAGADGERQPVHGGPLAMAFREFSRFDHVTDATEDGRTGHLPPGVGPYSARSRDAGRPAHPRSAGISAPAPSGRLSPRPGAPVPSRTPSPPAGPCHGPPAWPSPC